MNQKIINAKNALTLRIGQLGKWLDEHGNGCREQQGHLEEGSPLRAYWHYGYWVGLVDALALLTAEGED